MPQISVIVPVYKVEPYLHKCVGSILAQTFTDFELILVDDGSPDNCGKICDEYAEKDNRVIVIHKKNGGLASARNAGIVESKGNYILFVDSDDYIEPQTLDMLLKASKSNADIVIFGGTTFPQNKDIDCWINTRKYIYNNPWRALIYETGARPFAWNKLIKTALIKDYNILFDETITFGEDQPFFFDLFPVAKKIVFIDDKLYHYRQRSNSMMEQLNNKLDEKTIKHMDQVVHIYNSWKSKGYLIEHGRTLQKWINDFTYLYIDSISDETKQYVDSICQPMYEEIERITVEKQPKNLPRIAKKIHNKIEQYTDNGLVYSLKKFSK